MSTTSITSLRQALLCALHMLGAMFACGAAEEPGDTLVVSIMQQRVLPASTHPAHLQAEHCTFMRVSGVATGMHVHNVRDNKYRMQG